MESSRRIINSCIEDAKSRYKIVNGDVCNFAIPQTLLQQLYKIKYEEKPLVSIRDDSLKVTLFHEGKQNIIDYKSACPNAIFITEYIPDAKKRIMKISELKINKNNTKIKQWQILFLKTYFLPLYVLIEVS